ncbi:MAG: nucleoside kinase [Bacteroidaceae bacterium]|nr:nucleoside kinase [Bacteroidaceae bacterium]
MKSPKLEALIAEQKRWQETVGIGTVAELNAAVRAGHATDIINVCEVLQARKIARVADEIYDLGRRLVLLAGPSSSGKTTTSKRLGIQLAALGLRPTAISMDDYFVNRVNTPLDENGEYDYECLGALDVPYFNKQLTQLLSGETVSLPRYDFVSGERVPSGRELKLEKNNVLIIEGIHALNPDLTPQIPRDEKFLLYVTALTTIQIDEKKKISTSDARLLRRMLRDKNFRNYSAEETLHRWPSVRAGEEKWIFPFEDNCDMMVNTALNYELSVLRTHVLPILEEVPESSPEYAESLHLRSFIGLFEPIRDKQIPPTSLLREFLGGSSFHY